ncbi:MAG: MBL fold metallo-hydrolase, partial [Chloroflexi bacterium]|nr:MBL fold metallo-hydrolase [Chloroflexota bacterium]
ARFPHTAVAARERLDLGGARIEPIASPGHTPEHLAYVVHLPQSPPLLFSGGALIVGGAARTDLIAPDQTVPLTRALYRTTREAFRALPDETALLPTHGGGSFCSTGAGGERTSTLGRERADNPVLAEQAEQEFLDWFPKLFPAVPAYFARMRAGNQAGAADPARIAPPRPLPPSAFEEAAARGALVVDVRPTAAYMAEHLPGALSNPFRDAYATWLGWLVDPETPLLFVLGDVPLTRVLEESLLVGYERFAGVLEGGVETWARSGRETRSTPFLRPVKAATEVATGAVPLDVREPDEFAAGHIDGALHIPLGSLPGRESTVPRDRPVVVYCGHGERAATAVSLLERAGLEALRNLDGGFGAWREMAGRC